MFTEADPDVRDIAAIFALKGWEWVVRDQQMVPTPFVPEAHDIARTLNRLLRTVESGQGSSASGRLFVTVGSDLNDITFGIEWNR